MLFPSPPGSAWVSKVDLLETWQSSCSAGSLNELIKSAIQSDGSGQYEILKVKG